MKTNLRKFLSVITLAGACGWCGCTTNDAGKRVPDIERISLGIRETVKTGTKFELARNPASRTAFSAALVALTDLSSSPAITPNALLNVINRLPVKQFTGTNGQLAFDSAGIVVALTNWSKVNAERQAQLRPIVQAFIDGLVDAGITP